MLIGRELNIDLLIFDIDLDRFVQEILLESLDALAGHLLVGGQPDEGDVVQLGVAAGGLEAGRETAQLGFRHCGAVAVVDIQHLQQTEDF